MCVGVWVCVRHAKVKLGTGGNKPISQNLISCELKGRKSERWREKEGGGGKRERKERKKNVIDRVWDGGSRTEKVNKKAW